MTHVLESGRALGWKGREPHDERDHHVVGLAPGAEAALPLKYSLRKEMPPIYDQGSLGSCTGNGWAAVMQEAERDAHDSSGVPSRLFIYYHERLLEGTVGEDSGAYVRDGAKVVSKLGVPPESAWPYDISRFAEAPSAQAEARAGSHKALEYLRVVPGMGSPFRKAIVANNPIVFGFQVPAEFEDLTPDQPLLHMPTPHTQWIGGHCVVAVGYDFTQTRFPMNVIEVRNSWGPNWGDDGHFYMDAGWATNRQLTNDFWIVRKAT